MDLIDFMNFMDIMDMDIMDFMNFMDFMDFINFMDFTDFMTASPQKLPFFQVTSQHTSLKQKEFLWSILNELLSLCRRINIINKNTYFAS